MDESCQPQKREPDKNQNSKKLENIMNNSKMFTRL
jgi:hypothetical protein